MKQLLKMAVAAFLVMYGVVIISSLLEGDSSHKESAAVDVSAFSHEDACKAATSMEMAREPKIMTAIMHGSVVHNAYTRPEDNATYRQRCKFNGDRITWIDDTENSPDASFEFREFKGRLLVTRIYADGTARGKWFDKADFVSGK